MHHPLALALALALLTLLTLTTALPLPSSQNLTPLIDKRQAATDSLINFPRAQDSVSLPAYLNLPSTLDLSPSALSLRLRSPAKPALVHNTGAFTPATPSAATKPKTIPAQGQAETLRQGGVNGGTGSVSSDSGRTGTTGTTGGVGRGDVVLSPASGAEVPGRSGVGGMGVGVGVGKGSVIAGLES